MPNLTLTDNTNTPILPEFDSDTSSDKVQVAVTDKQSADALTARVNDLVQKVQQDGGTTNLSGVVSSDRERTVAEQIAAAIKTGKTITLEAAAAPLDSSAAVSYTHLKSLTKTDGLIGKNCWNRRNGTVNHRTANI